MILLGLAILKDFNDKNSDEQNNLDIIKQVSEFTSVISPVILPIISTLGELQIENE